MHYHLILSALLLLTSLSAACAPAKTLDTERPELETYVYSQDAPSSRLYYIEIDGIRQTVYASNESHICSFGCSGKVKVKVFTTFGAKTVKVMPQHREFEHSFNKNEQLFTIELGPSDRAVVEFNDSEEHPLFIFANPLSNEIKPDSSSKSVRYFEAGKIYTNYSHLQVKSGETLFLEGGAVLKSKVYALDASDVKILGYGIIDATDIKEDANGLRLQRCTNAQVQGITILNNTGRVMFNEESSNVTIDNVKAIGNVEGSQTDAIDIYGCHDYQIRRCFAYGNDDTYCIKSWKWGFKGEVYNISFDDCIARNWRGNSFEIGYETGIDIHDISYTNICSIRSSQGGTPFRRGAVTIHNAASGTISNISYENVYIEDPLEGGIDMRILKAGYQLGTGEEWGPGITKGITMKNVWIAHMPPQGNNILGYDDNHTISLDIENLYIGGRKVLSAEEGAFNVSYSDIKIR